MKGTVSIMNSDLNAYEKNDIEFSDGSERPEAELIEPLDTGKNARKPAPKKSGNGKTEIVGVRFRKNGKTYYFAPKSFKLSRDNRVIVDTARGQEYGYVAVPNRMINDSEIVAPLRSVIRMASAEDTKTHEENLKKEVDAFNSCIMLIDENKLEMKLIDVEMSFDRSKLIFYFSSEERVDFRELVKELAGKFRMRIEMRQIGIRDEAKILGGLGICGRPFCCSSFLTDFVQVSVKMAKEQNLSLNSAKISGSCGRLMCCLRYEYDTYLAEKALTPKVDTRVMTPEGAGVVTAANPLAGIVKVKLDKKADDADVVFVREDVVKENEYKGEKLVKSAVPEKKHKEQERDMFAFAGASLGGLSEKTPETPAPEPQKQTGVTPEKRQEQQSVKKENAVDNVPRGQENAQNENKQGGKKKHHHHHHRPNNQKRDGGENKQQQKPQEQQKPAPQNNGQNNAQRNENKSGEQNGEKKKHFKPYYRNHKKNKNKGGSDAQGK